MVILIEKRYFSQIDVKETLFSYKKFKINKKYVFELHNKFYILQI